MTNIWIIDIDKTIADCSHREHLLRPRCISCNSFDISNGVCLNCVCDILQIPTESWKAFTDPHLLKYDTPVSEAQEVISLATNRGIDIHYITGRQPQARSATQQWLEDNFNFDKKVNKLLMRDIDSYLQDKNLHVKASVHKEQKLKQLKEICGYTDKDSFSFFDDDRKVLEMYSKYGTAFLAPECWKLMYHPVTNTVELLFNK